MRAPSGDQAGASELLSVPGILCGVSEGLSTFTVYKASDPTKTMVWPSGLQAGSTSPVPKVTCRAPDPSALATQMCSLVSLPDCAERIVSTRVPSGDQLACRSSKFGSGRKPVVIRVAGSTSASARGALEGCSV